MKIKILKEKNTLVVSFFLIIAFITTGLFLGFNNLSFTSDDWLYDIYSYDRSNAQNAWTFFKEDFWHFPIGSNPNYGLDVANSIIFTDSIPVLAFFFKIFSFALPENFQYFSFWIFLCFFLQLYSSYLLINFFTKNIKFSLLGSFLFLLLPFYLFRLGHHPSLGAHWLLLIAFYFNFSVSDEKKKFYWLGVILTSLLVHLYFTAMLIIMYMVFFIKEILIKKKFKKKILEFFLLSISIFFLMFVAGYFNGSPIDAISRGYGVFKSDFFAIIDPVFDHDLTNWSIVINDLWPSHFEGFNYIGLGNIGAFLLVLFILIKKKNKNETFKTINNNYEYIFLFIIFSFWSFTTNFTIAGTDIFNIPLNKYLYGLLSIFGATGRFLWPPIYMLIIFSIIYIFRYFKDNKKYYIIIFFIAVQLVDIYPKIKSNFVEKKELKIDKLEFTDTVWKSVSEDYDKLRTTYLFNNYGPMFSKLSKFITAYNVKSTDIILNASMSRVNAAKARYNLNDLFNKGLVQENTAYIVDNLGHLKHLKHIFSFHDVGFFYRNNLWIMLPKKKKDMNIKDVDRFNKINFKKIESNRMYKLNISEKENFLGLGWTHNFDKEGVWSEGNIATLMLNLDKIKKKNHVFKANIKKYDLNLNDNYICKIFINKKLKKVVNLNQMKKNDILEFKIDQNEINSETVINFKFEGLISPYDRMISPDARKLGILIKNFAVNELK